MRTRGAKLLMNNSLYVIILVM